MRDAWKGALHAQCDQVLLRTRSRDADVPSRAFGRRRTDSLTLAPRSYQTHRLRLLFERGFLFYAEYNFRLFFFIQVAAITFDKF